MTSHIFSHNCIAEKATELVARRANALPISKDEFINHVGDANFSALKNSKGEAESFHASGVYVYASIQNIDFMFIKLAAAHAA